VLFEFVEVLLSIEEFEFVEEVLVFEVELSTSELLEV
jgi:hypothetical protein